MKTTKKAPAVRQLKKKSRGTEKPRAGRHVMWLSAVVMMGAITACSPRIDTRGNAIHMEDVATLETGVHTRDHVLNKLGSPSNRTTFGDTTWYYISEKTETTAFFAPELIERQIVVIDFNEHGVVEKIDVFDKESAELVEPTDRKTPTAGNSLGMIEQLLSNLGRFNKK